MELIKGKKPEPWVAAIYGVPGCGKSTLATYADDPVFIDVEGGLSRIDCVRNAERITTMEALREALKWAIGCPHRTVVIDSLTAVEEILTNQILEEKNRGRDPQYLVTSLADKDAFPYGAGHEILKAKWTLFAKMLFKIRDAGKNVLCICHEGIEKVENPSGENYDRYTLQLHKKSVPVIVSKMDAVLFAHYGKFLKSKAGSDKKIAFDKGERQVLTMEKAFAVAKNRFGLADMAPFNTPEESAAIFAKMDERPKARKAAKQ